MKEQEKRGFYDVGKPLNERISLARDIKELRELESLLDAEAELERQELEAMREIREREYVRAVDRLERFERRASNEVHTYNDTEKQAIWFDEDGILNEMTEPIDPEERDALDTAVLITEEYERDYEQEPWDSLDPPILGDDDTFPLDEPDMER